MLNVTVQFMVEKIIERQNLIAQIEARGGTVSDELKEYVSPHPSSAFSVPNVESTCTEQHG